MNHTKAEYAKHRARLLEKYGLREEFLATIINDLAISEQPCDVLYYHKKPAINVTISPDHVTARTLQRERISWPKLSNGDLLSLDEVWGINPMPKKGFTEEELATVDMSMADNRQDLKEKRFVK